jgi:hypothetical protein
LPPNGFRLRLDTGNTVKHGDRAVQNTQRAFDFHRKINVTGRINNINPMFDTCARPVTSRCGGGNRNSTLLFLLHPVHRRRAFVDFADFMRNAGVIKHALGGRGFTRVDVRHDSDVSVFI